MVRARHDGACSLGGVPVPRRGRARPGGQGGPRHPDRLAAGRGGGRPRQPGLPGPSAEPLHPAPLRGGLRHLRRQPQDAQPQPRRGRPPAAPRLAEAALRRGGHRAHAGRDHRRHQAPRVAPRLSGAARLAAGGVPEPPLRAPRDRQRGDAEEHHARGP